MTRVQRCGDSPSSAMTCPGCGLQAKVTMPVSECRYHASKGCWQRFEELSAYGFSRRDPAFKHQTVVDAYGAQHISESTPTLGASFALIGLYLSLEQGYTGRQVQLAHMALAKHPHDWPRLTPPHCVGDLTVQDALQAEPGESRDAVVTDWASAVWSAWEKDHAWVADTSERLLKLT